MENKKRKLRIIPFLTLLLVIIIIGWIVIFVMNLGYQKLVIKPTTMYIVANTSEVAVCDKEGNKTENLYRGTKIKVYEKDTLMIENNKYYKSTLGKKVFYIFADNVTTNKTEVVSEEKLYVRTASTIINDIEERKPIALADKGEELEVIDYNKLDDKGVVDYYKVKKGDIIGYLASKYVVFSKEEALKRYEPEKYYEVHEARKNPYNGGSPANLDYYPNKKPSFKNNDMPDPVYALYLNNGHNVISNVDDYIDFAKTTNINTFVVDIKDNTTPGYKSEVMKKYSPTNYKYGINSKEDYKEAIKKIKDAGFYVVGRITVFKDQYYVKDHPEDAIANKGTGEPFKHNGTYWPTPYSRDVWEFNVELAKEAVKEFGFNEIQFDYVRFPDRTQTLEKKGVLDYKNVYNEEKGQAIQRFLQYARDELHKLEAYISADVFGESAGLYVTGYGQYFPAISNVVDVISGMPYPDHFAPYSYGIPKPWNEPYKLMNSWGKDVAKRQTEIPTPAKVRTWIQAYDVLSYVDKNGLKYNAEELEAQIKGLFDAGLTGGYMTWNSASNLKKYKAQIEAFKKEYSNEKDSTR